MITIVSESALEILSDDAMLSRLGDPCQASNLEWSTFSWSDVRELGGLIAFDQRRPIHVLVGKPADRVHSDRVVSHVWSGPIPPGSLYHLAPGVLIASPGFCYLMASGSLSKPRAISIGMECVGLYGRRHDARGFSDRNQLMTKAELVDYLKGAKGCYGCRNALRFLPYVLERSRSPVETAMVLVLTIPSREGGFGLPRPELNMTIRPRPNEFSLSQRSHYEVDACWERQRLVLEYNSYSDHLSREALDRDAMKANSLRSLGWKVLVVTRAQLEGDALSVLAYQVARGLGIKRRHPKAEERDRLLEELL